MNKTKENETDLFNEVTNKLKSNPLHKIQKQNIKNKKSRFEKMLDSFNATTPTITSTNKTEVINPTFEFPLSLV